MSGPLSSPKTIAGIAVEQFHAGFLPGAHHPHCPRHSNHLLWIRGRPLCLGCTCMSAGTVVGLVLGVALASRSSSTLAWILPHVALVAPTALQPWVQAKAFKIAARTALGLASGSYGVGLAFGAPLPAPRLISVVVLIAVFLASLFSLLWLRRRRPNDPCKACPLGVFPTCDWNLPRLLGHDGDGRVRLPVSGRLV